MKRQNTTRQKIAMTVGMMLAMMLAMPPGARAQAWAHRPARPQGASAHDRTGYGKAFEDNRMLAFEVGYVTKRFGTKAPVSGRVHENLWGDEDKFFNGLRMGLACQPMTESHFGVRTGIFYEVYISGTTTLNLMGYNRFTEHDLYFPLRMAYRIETDIPLSIDLTTGVGLNIAMAGVYKAWGRAGRTDHQKYGNYLEEGESIIDGREEGLVPPRLAPVVAVGDERVENAVPDRLNAMWEFGVAVRYKAFAFGMDYGLGLNDHEFYEHARTRQNKFSLSVGVTF